MKQVVTAQQVTLADLHEQRALHCGYRLSICCRTEETHGNVQLNKFRTPIIVSAQPLISTVHSELRVSASYVILGLRRAT